MQQVEETKSEISIRKKTQPKSKSSLPLDVTSEILLRLPAKSIVRFRCVSKLWSAIITDPCFTSSFNIRYSTRPSLLMVFEKGYEWFVFSIPHDDHNSNESYTSSMPIGRYQMKTPEYSLFRPTESINGLICFHDSGQYIMWNPTLRKFLTLPQPEESWTYSIIFLGYDPVEGKHKVMCMPADKLCDQCWVLTLESKGQHSWRMVKTNHMHLAGYRMKSRPRCINGVVYYEVRLADSKVNVAMSFDVRSEKFDVITLPTNPYAMLMPYEGRLACVDTNSTNGGITLWILEDAKKHKWSCKHFQAPLNHYVPSLNCHFELVGITHAGDFIYEPWGSNFNTTFYVVYFDPKRNSLREIEFADEEFKVRNGIEDLVWGTFYSSLYHMESLMFL